MGRSKKTPLALCALLLHLACDEHATEQRADQTPVQLEQEGSSTPSQGTSVSRATERHALQVPCDAGVCTMYGDEPSSAAVRALLTEVCALRLRCCTEAQNCGATFTIPVSTVEECLAAVEKKQTNAFWNTGALYEISTALNALAAPNLRLKVNTEGMSACAAFVRESETCSPEKTTGRCDLPTLFGEPCGALNLVTGLRQRGEPCATFAEVPDCAEGTACHAIPADTAFGVCGTRAKEGDRCTNDAHCDGLFCNPETYQCQRKGGLSAPCGLLSNFRSDTSIDCESPLECDRINHVCVRPCEHGTQCKAHADCAPGLLCDTTLYPDTILDGIGLCVAPLVNGSPCEQGDVQTTNQDGNRTYENACASGICSHGANDEVYKCRPS